MYRYKNFFSFSKYINRVEWKAALSSEFVNKTASK